MTLICGLFLTSGCGEKPPKTVVPKKALFCDVEEKRKFTQEELDWRAQHAPWNLRRDFKTNKTWDREECSVPTSED